MMVPISIRLVLETTSEKSARVVLARLQGLFDFDLLTLAPYHKGGFEANLTAKSSGQKWQAVVLGVIELAQSFGSGWGISGSIQDEIELVASDSFRIPGIQFAWIVALKREMTE
jgi:hypothetical protein